jgi:two-component system nitrogen regulation sensor histidine kinase GlnL
VFPRCEILHAAVENAIENHSPFREHEFIITTLRQNSLAVTCTVTPVDMPPACLVLEFQQMDQQLRIAREERMLIQQQANAELLRNLAHEIRNPLGGLRGAAQLLEHELPQVSLREYTQVIIKEADRLQSLMDRLLVPHRVPKYEPTNIHEVLERVRSLLLAESPKGMVVQRDYDTSAGRTQPMKICSILSASTPARATAARTAAAPSSVALTPESAPWKPPIGVRANETMTTGSADMGVAPLGRGG